MGRRNRASFRTGSNVLPTRAQQSTCTIGQKCSRIVLALTAGALVTASVLAFQAATESSGLAFADSSPATIASPTSPETTTIGPPSCAAGDQGCCRNDADCDDGDGCTVDACVPTKGCTHAPV